MINSNKFSYLNTKLKHHKLKGSYLQKNMRNIKVENYVSLNGLSENFQAWKTIFQVALRDCSEKVRATIDRSFCNKYKVVIKRLLLKENQLSQVNEFSSFLSTGQRQSLSLLKSSFLCEHQLSRASILFFPILSPYKVNLQKWLPWLRD